MNPNLTLLLQAFGLSGSGSSAGLGAGAGPQFTGGDPKTNPLAAILMASGQLTKRKDLSGRYILPGGKPSSGLDWLAQNGAGRYMTRPTPVAPQAKPSTRDWYRETLDRYR